MKQKWVLLCVLSGCMLFGSMAIYSLQVSASEIESYAQISFQMPEYIPVEQLPTNGIESTQGILVNAPVSNGKYDRQFGYVSTRKEVIPVITQLPSLGVTHIQSLSYILCSAFIITMVTISRKKRKEKREEL